MQSTGTFRSVVGLTVACVLAAVAVRPQARPDVPTFEAGTELVYVRFHVEKDGRYLEDVTREQVRVLEDGRPQEIVVLETAATRERTIPPEVTLVLDVSSSVMDARLLDEALLREVFFAGLSEETKVGLCAFGGELRCLAPPTRDVSSLMSAFHEAIGFSRETRHQGTRLYASVADVCRQASESGKSQRAVIVFSDGLDNREGKVEDAVQAAVESDVRVHAVKLSQAFQDGGRFRIRGAFGGAPNRAMYDYRKFDLDQLAEETGGEAYEPGTLDQQSLAKILRTIATGIRTENILGYQPDGPATGKKRKVKVELVDRSLGKIRDGERTVVR
jgi:VWFA-related protein